MHSNFLDDSCCWHKWKVSEGRRMTIAWMGSLQCQHYLNCFLVLCLVFSQIVASVTLSPLIVFHLFKLTVIVQPFPKFEAFDLSSVPLARSAAFIVSLCFRNVWILDLATLYCNAKSEAQTLLILFTQVYWYPSSRSLVPCLGSQVLFLPSPFPSHGNQRPSLYSHPT